MADGFSEDIVEHAGIEILKDLGWTYFHGASIAPDGPAPQRPSFSEPFLIKRLTAAIAKLNPSLKLPKQAIVPVRRSDGSGTTYNFAYYLAEVSPDWKTKVGVSTALLIVSATSLFLSTYGAALLPYVYIVVALAEEAARP